MAKRFIDSSTWSDPWFQELDPMIKLFYIYLFTICDMIGIWEFNPKRAEFDLNKKINWESIKESLKDKVDFHGDVWIIKSFIKQQYPNLLKKPKAPLHIAVMNELDKKCLKLNENSLSIDYWYTIDSVQVIVKEKVIVKEEEKKGDQPSLFPPEQELKYEDFMPPEHLMDEWKSYLDVRKSKKAAKTYHALELIVAELEKLAPGNNQLQLDILKKSIRSNWTDVYPLKNSDKEKFVPEFQKNQQDKYNGY